MHRRRGSMRRPASPPRAGGTRSGARPRPSPSRRANRCPGRPRARAADSRTARVSSISSTVRAEPPIGPWSRIIGDPAGWKRAARQDAPQQPPDARSGGRRGERRRRRRGRSRRRRRLVGRRQLGACRSELQVVSGGVHRWPSRSRRATPGRRRGRAAIDAGATAGVAMWSWPYDPTPRPFELRDRSGPTGRTGPRLPRLPDLVRLADGAWTQTQRHSAPSGFPAPAGAGILRASRPHRRQADNRRPPQAARPHRRSAGHPWRPSRLRPAPSGSPGPPRSAIHRSGL